MSTLINSLKHVRLIWRVAATLICAWGLAVMIGITEGNFNAPMLGYYTVQSNLVCLLYTLILVVFDIAGTRIRYEKIAGAVTIMISVTMLVYNLILDRTGFSMNGNSMDIANMIVHLVVPLMILADWLFFTPKGHLGAREPFFWLAIPFTYYLFVVARAEIFGLIPGRNTRFPYFFIDSDALGIQKVALNVLILSLAFLALGYILVGLDTLLARMTKTNR